MLATKEYDELVQDQKRAIRAAHQSLHIPCRAPRILLAEDETDVRRLIATVLRRDGYEIVEAQHGPELLERLFASQLDSVSFDFELVISDVRMPGISGLEMLRGLRKYDDAPPVILITAFGSDEVHAEARKLGAVHMFDKPFDVDQLRSFVRRIVPPTSLVVGGKPPTE